MSKLMSMHSLIRLFGCSMIVLFASFCTGNENQNAGTSGNGEEKTVVHDVFSPGKKLGMLKSKKLEEVSGLAASISNPGMLWTLNDSNNPAEVYLIDQETNIRMTCKLEGVENRDWEEIAVGPGPETGKQYVYVGDIGDNLAAHEHKFIYRFEEPVLKKGKEKVNISHVDVIRFSLSDERRDAEAFFVDPRTRDIYIISKWKSPVDLYRLKYSSSTESTEVAQRIGTLPLSTVVASSFNIDGSELLVKNYKGVFYFKRQGDMSVAAMLKQPPIQLPYEKEPQGEAIAWSATGDGYYTLSEKKKDHDIHLMFYERIAK